MEKFPSFPKFERLVREKTRLFLKAFDQQEVEEFLVSEEAVNTMKMEYKSCMKKYKDGECNLYAAYNGGSDSTAFCLSMMF
jgi:predicted PP-loop superfamily ATPase